MDIQEAQKDIPGKGSGTKDACYYKVKSRFRVWPSAYGSASLVRCRKMGAKNWGNKNEEYVYEEKKYCPSCMRRKVKCECSHNSINESRRLMRFIKKHKGKLMKVPDAILALSFAANVAQSPESFISSGKVQAPSVQLMSGMMRKRGKATVSGLDNARVSHPARNKVIGEGLSLIHI